MLSDLSGMTNIGVMDKQKNDQKNNRKNDTELFKRLHDDAVERGDDFYVDPDTQAFVFTEVYHRNRGECCGSNCRHCPFDYVNVSN